MSHFVSQPWFLLSIPAVWVTAILPEVYKARTLQNTQGFKFDPVQPRDNMRRFEATQGIDKALSARVSRMDGAPLNGLENLPLWIGAILVGNSARLEPSTLNKVALFYIVTRSLYGYIYVNQATSLQARLRTIVFFAALSAPMYLFVASWLKVYTAAS